MTPGAGARPRGVARIGVEAALVFAVVLLYLWPFRLYGFDVTDEGVQLVQIERAAAGERPQVDFETSYTPGYFALHAGLWRVFGAGLVTTRTFGVALQAATVALGFALARRFVGPLLAAVAAALEVAFLLPVSLRFGAPFNTPYPGWVANLLALAAQGGAALSALGRAEDASRRKAAGASLGALAVGFFAGLAFSVKPNCGMFALAGGALALSTGWRGGETGARAISLLLRAGAVAGVVFLLRGGSDAGWLLALGLPALLAALRAAPLAEEPARHQGAGGGREGARSALPLADCAALALGFLLPVLPWALRLAVELGPAAAIESTLHLEGSSVRAYLLAYPLPGPATAALLLGLLAAGALAGIVGTRRPPAAAPLALLAGLVAAAFLGAASGARATAEDALLWLGAAALAIGLATVDSADVGERALLVFAALFQLQIYPRADLIHVAMGAAPVALAATVTFGRLAAAWRGQARSPAIALAAAAIGLALAAGRALPTLVPRLREPVVDLDLGPRAPVVLSERHAAEAAWLGEAVREVRARSRPDDAVFGFPDLPGVGFLAGRAQPYYYLYFVPGRPDRADQPAILARLEQVRPRLALVRGEVVPAFAGASDYFDQVTAYLGQHYQPVARAGGCTVLERRASSTP